MSTPDYHDESGAHLGWWAVPFALSVLIPGLWWTWADRPFALRPDLVITMTVLVGSVALVLLASISRLFRYRLRWSLGVATVALTVLFQWSTLTAAGSALADTLGVGFVQDVFPVAMGGALLWLAARRAHELAFAVVIGGSVTVAVIALAFNAMTLAGPAPRPAQQTDHADTRPVLLLVLDGYARADWMRDEYGFDNGEFLAELEDRGFYVAPEATSNYGYTYASLSSILNLDYVFTPGRIDRDQQQTMRSALLGSNGLMAALRDAGYDVAYIENAWGGSQCGPGVDWCIRDGLVGRAAWNLGQMTILAPIFENVFSDPFNALSMRHLESLPSLLADAARQTDPTFFFAHLLLPHQPLLLNDDCTLNDTSELTRWGAEGGELLRARRSRYATQVRCVNTMVIEAIDSFIAARPDAIVMITADHGPGSLLDVNLPLEDLIGDTIAERMSILSAYRVEGCPDRPYASITPINGARLVANCVTGDSLAFLPDRNLWADLDAEGMVVDITAQVPR